MAFSQRFFQSVWANILVALDWRIVFLLHFCSDGTDILDKDRVRTSPPHLHKLIHKRTHSPIHTHTERLNLKSMFVLLHLCVQKIDPYTIYTVLFPLTDFHCSLTTFLHSSYLHLLAKTIKITAHYRV